MPTAVGARVHSPSATVARRWRRHRRDPHRAGRRAAAASGPEAHADRRPRRRGVRIVGEDDDGCSGPWRADRARADAGVPRRGEGEDVCAGRPFDAPGRGTRRGRRSRSTRVGSPRSVPPPTTSDTLTATPASRRAPPPGSRSWTTGRRLNATPRSAVSGGSVTSERVGGVPGFPVAREADRADAGDDRRGGVGPGRGAEGPAWSRPGPAHPSRWSLASGSRRHRPPPRRPRARRPDCRTRPSPAPPAGLGHGRTGQRRLPVARDALQHRGGTGRARVSERQRRAGESGRAGGGVLHPPRRRPASRRRERDHPRP